MNSYILKTVFFFLCLLFLQVFIFNHIVISKNMIMTNHVSSNYFLADFQFEYNNALKFLVIKINQDFITSLEKQHCFFISDGTHEFKIKIIS